MNISCDIYHISKVRGIIFTAVVDQQSRIMCYNWVKSACIKTQNKVTCIKRK